MSPGRTLIEIGLAKAELREAIRCRRRVVAEAGAGIGRALGWVDRVLDLWRRLPLLAKAVPLLTSLVIAVRLGRRTPGVRPWLPVLSAAFRLLRDVWTRGSGETSSTRLPAQRGPVVSSTS